MRMDNKDLIIVSGLLAQFRESLEAEQERLLNELSGCKNQKESAAKVKAINRICTYLETIEGLK